MTPFNESLNRRLRDIPYQHYKLTINALAQYCNVSKNVIYNWRTGRTYIRRRYCEKIEEFFNERIFDQTR
ncbi:MAG: helix-turn-helix transcriptional regulator [Bacteroidales bacterium]|jgi:predicted transcriptional regulator|nr:helix-turn-helix transcriptional regulator [Bacteroidales bacterium]MDD3153031.1 helix-turn-helix transcriptional regulator [Bacteroidales bacterium]MDD3915356.1 helix-turn-helix transcriptional regulator [Bacteroidales bacterium]MDD4634963.1 helix-turn-helix transcriptional regulator [Bacteroidales bacterium]